MNGFSRTTGFYASLLLALTLGAVGCKGNQNANSTQPSSTDQSQQAATQPAADQSQPDPNDPANANIVPVSNATTGTASGSSATSAQSGSEAAAPSSSGSAVAPSESAQSGMYGSAQLSTAQYNEDNGYGEQPETYAEQAPPELPQYEQPACPGEGYLFTPGYWGWANPGGYYWIPGAWVRSPYEGALWTPGYWGWRAGRYAFYSGYWGRHIGFYGGINYGFGYGGFGYHGGYWRGNSFMYNRSVNNIDVHVVRNVYDYRVVNITNTRVSFNGGHGGVQYRPRQGELVAAVREQHNPPMATQVQIREGAQHDRQNFVEVNHGKPAMVVVNHPVQADHNVRPPAAVNYHEHEQPMRAIAQQPDRGHPGRPMEQQHPAQPQQHGANRSEPARAEPNHDVKGGQHEPNRPPQEHNQQHPAPHQPTPQHEQPNHPAPQHAEANHPGAAHQQAAHSQQERTNEQKKNEEKKKAEERRPQ